jgi:hypothetical protein
MNHGAGGAAPSFEQAISGDSAAVITTTDARDGATWTIQMRCLPDIIDRAIRKVSENGGAAAPN